MGCEALSFLLDQLGSCQPSYQLKDSVIESKRPFSNVILLCIYVFKYVSNGLRDYAIANAQSWNNLFSPICRCAKYLHGIVGIGNGINRRLITCDMLLIMLYDYMIMMISRILTGCKSNRKAPFVQSAYFLTQNFQQACRMPTSPFNPRSKHNDFV